uniref:Synergin gamma C-terminal domain-containing protein n=1 Tax=Salvator merianae TaxID=96440 RepID=A0A8D0DY17_SALMN
VQEVICFSRQVIRRANEIFADISQPSVCREVLLSEAGTTYILALSEVYQISRRLKDGLKARNLVNKQLQHRLHEVDLVWNNLLSFLVFGCSSSQMLLLMSSDSTDSSFLDPDQAPNHVCGICLAEVKHNPEVHSGNSHPVIFQGCCYHAGCANFWLNCVDCTLPRET